MGEPNTSLRAVRHSMRLSQEELARAIRQAGQRTGEPNACTKRLIQRWEAGTVTTPRGAYARALEYVTGQPVESLGFKPADETYGLDRGRAMDTGGAWIPLEDPKARGPLTGIWLSRYEYESSSRNETFTSEHYVVVIQHGARLQVRSVPASASKLMLDLTANGQVVTGTWTEQTSAGGYYQGSVYHGAIQFLIDPTGHRMTGRWVGFGRDFDLNTGPWTLQLVSADTGTAAMAQHNKQPEPAERTPGELDPGAVPTCRAAAKPREVCPMCARPDRSRRSGPARPVAGGSRPGSAASSWWARCSTTSRATSGPVAASTSASSTRSCRPSSRTAGAAS